MKLSFVVPAHNEEAYLGECLQSILRNASGRYHEIIVVDNASTDNTSAVAKSYPDVRVVHEERLGITHARQRGLDEASGELLAYVDADTRLPSTWIPMIEDAFEGDPNLVCLSGPYRYYDGGLIKRRILDTICWSVLLLGYWIFGYMLNGGNYVARRRFWSALGVSIARLISLERIQISVGVYI